MYRDVVQWSEIRHRVLVEGIRNGKSYVRPASAARPSARCSTIRTRSRMGRRPQVSEARSAYRLDPADAPRERYHAAHGPGLHPGHVRAHPRRGGLRRQIQYGEGLRTADLNALRIASGNTLRPARIAGQRASDRLPVPPIPRRPASDIPCPHRAIFPATSVE